MLTALANPARTRAALASHADMPPHPTPTRTRPRRLGNPGPSHPAPPRSVPTSRPCPHATRPSPPDLPVLHVAAHAVPRRLADPGLNSPLHADPVRADRPVLHSPRPPLPTFHPTPALARPLLATSHPTPRRLRPEPDHYRRAKPSRDFPRLSSPTNQPSTRLPCPADWPRRHCAPRPDPHHVTPCRRSLPGLPTAHRRSGPTHPRPPPTSQPATSLS